MLSAANGEDAVSSIMTPDVVCAEPDRPAAQALFEMSQRRISCLVICEGAKPAGILTERDMVRFLANLKGGLGDDLMVQHLMSAPVVTARAQDTVDQVIALAHERRIRHVPIVDDSGALVGVVSQSDFLKACAERHLRPRRPPRPRPPETR